MARHHTQAVVLTSIDYGDYDRIVTLFTRDLGKIAGIAKGAKRSMKRFGGALETGAFIEVEFVEKKGASLVRLEHCTILTVWKNIGSSLGKYLIICQMLELVRALLPERERNNEVFHLLLRMMMILEGLPPSDDAPFLLAFEIKLLRLAGFRPNLEECVICRKALPEGASVGFSTGKGGCVCPSCRTDEPEVSPEGYQAMKTAIGLSLDDIRSFSPPRWAVTDARRLLREFVEIRIGRRLKASDVAEGLASYPTG